MNRRARTMNRGATTTRLLEYLISLPKNKKFYGNEIIESLQLSQGTVYPTLTRMYELGWLTTTTTVRQGSMTHLYWWAPGGRAAAQALLDKPRRRQLTT